MAKPYTFDVPLMPPEGQAKAEALADFLADLGYTLDWSWGERGAVFKLDRQVSREHRAAAAGFLQALDRQARGGSR